MSQYSFIARTNYNCIDIKDYNKEVDFNFSKNKELNITHTLWPPSNYSQCN